MSVPRRLLIAVVMIVSALAVGLLVALGSPTLEAALIFLNVAALAFAILARRASQPIDIFEPLTIFIAAWAVMFVLRPIGMLAYGDPTLRGTYDVSGALPAALLLSALGAASFGIAYSIRPARRLEEGVRSRLEGRGVGSGTANAIAMLCIAVSAFGGLAGFADSGTAYLSYLPLLAVPGSLLLLGVERPRWSVAPLIAIGGLLLLLLQAVAVGQRSIVLYVVGSLVVLNYLRRGQRPRATSVVLGSLLMLMIVVNALEVLRGSAQPGQPSDPAIANPAEFAPDLAMKRLATGGSTEMLPALALQIETEGKVWTFAPGHLVVAIATHWVPGSLWADKPLSSAELLYSRYFPDHYLQSKANAQFSVLGDFYFDMGTLGVLLGMFALGMVARLFRGLLTGAPTSRAAMLLYSPFIPVFVLMLRGDITLALGIMLFIYSPLIVAVAAGRSTRKAARPHALVGGPGTELWNVT